MASFALPLFWVARQTCRSSGGCFSYCIGFAHPAESSNHSTVAMLYDSEIPKW